MEPPRSIDFLCFRPISLDSWWSNMGALCWRGDVFKRIARGDRMVGISLAGSLGECPRSRCPDCVLGQRWTNRKR